MAIERLSHRDMSITVMTLLMWCMQAILGSWDKHASGGKDFMSTLAQRVSTNELCDRYTAFNTNYADAGLWGVSAIADKHVDLDDLAWCIMQVRVVL